MCTVLQGAGASQATAGEPCERLDRLYLISGERIVDEVATYRGEGRCFL